MYSRENAMLSVQMGEVMDMNEVLVLTCQRMKEEAGRPRDFWYEDLGVFGEGRLKKVRARRAVRSNRLDQLSRMHYFVYFLFG